MLVPSPGASPDPVPAPATQRISELDGVRGFAIAMVMLYHYAHFSLDTSSALWLRYLLLPLNLSWSGVDLFFVLSGLLIGGILLDNRDAPRYYQAFYARRVCRIFPLYYGMVFLLACGLRWLPEHPVFQGSMPFWPYPLFLQNSLGDFTRNPSFIGATWSLCVEEQFYLLFPFVVRRVSRRTLTVLMLGVILVAPLLRWTLILRGWDFANVHPLLATRADALAWGVLLAILLREEAARSWLARYGRCLWGALLLVPLGFASLLKWTAYSYVGTLGYSILACGYALTILTLLSQPPPGFVTFFRNSALRWLGSISYCVYLIHGPMLTAWFHPLGMDESGSIHDLPSFGAAMAALTLTMGIAMLSWRYLESKLIRWGHRNFPYWLAT